MRFAFVTDIHLGATEEGFQQQPRWVGAEAALLDRLGRWLDDHRVDWIIYGGDLLDDGSPDQIEQAVTLLSRLDRAALVCLGNHDLTYPQSFENWQGQVAHCWPGAFLADTHVELDGCVLLALNNYWLGVDGPALFWNPQTGNIPSVTGEQLAWLDRVLHRYADRPAIIVMHASLDALPQELTGLDEPIHQPPPEYVRSVSRVLDGHRNISLVLSGHCHVTCALPSLGRIHLTTAAFSEVPFQVRLIDVGEDVITVSTDSIGPIPAGLKLDRTKAWVAGRDSDRQLSLDIPAR